MLWTFWILFYTIQINVVPFFMKTKSDFEIYCEARIFLKRVTSSNKCIDFELISLFTKKSISLLKFMSEVLYCSIKLLWNFNLEYHWWAIHMTYMSNASKIQLPSIWNYYCLNIWIFIFYIGFCFNPSYNTAWQQ